MTDKLRSAERVLVNLHARWDGNFDQREGTITDISTGGCFVLTAGEVSPMELVEVEIELPTEGRWVRLWGQVMYFVEEIGFGLRFAGINDEQLALLKRVIEQARDNR